jgi:large subunit ribosomal protein L29
MLSSKDIRELTEAEINSRIADLEEERFRLKFRAGTETLEDPLRLRVLRKDVARLKTVLKEKIIGIEYANRTSSQR